MQIVLLVTKAVGDFLGTHGIADEMIRFNGFPFLDKEEHVFNVPGTYNFFGQSLRPHSAPVSSVMKKELHTLNVSDMTVRQVGGFQRFIPLGHAIQ